MVEILAIDNDRVEARLASLNIEAVRLDRNSAPFPLWLVKARDMLMPSAILSTCERERSARFRFSELKDRYVAAHTALRVIVEERFDIPAGRQEYAVNAFGKPRLAGLPRAQMSISYSGEHALIGLTTGAPIGVDIEALRHIDDAANLMKLYYTRREQAALCACRADSAAFDRMFLKIWTRKEACVKALGQGLGACSLATLECGSGGLTTVRIGSSQLHTDTTHVKRRYIAAWAVLSV